MRARVKCIERPDEGTFKRNVTVGRIYDVVVKNKLDYLLYDDADEKWYYLQKYFEEEEPTPKTCDENCDCDCDTDADRGRD